MNIVYEKLKIIHRQHSGRLRPHEHTSYLPLAVLIFVTGLLLGLFTFFPNAQASPGPDAGSVGLTGSVPAVPPKNAAVITTPGNGQHFLVSPIVVAGTCSDGSLIEIYKNDIFGGSIPCDSGGKFSINIDLLYGQNILIAKIFDSLNQAGPDSDPVTVFFDGHPPQTGITSALDLTGAQLILSTDAVYRGKFPGQTLNVPVNIIGGTPPFAIVVDWGDSKNSTIPRGNNSVFNASHIYNKAGIFKITFKGTDSKQLVAFLQVAAFINGQPSVVASTDSGKPSINKLLLIWPIFAIAVTLVVSFWLGERREKRVLAAANRMTPPMSGIAPQPHA